MESIKKRSNRAYILLESLIALSLLALITTFMLSDINASQRQIRSFTEQNEALNVAKMAFDSNQDRLSANGVSIYLLQDAKDVTVKDSSGKEILQLEILEIKK